MKHLEFCIILWSYILIYTGLVTLVIAFHKPKVICTTVSIFQKHCGSSRKLWEFNPCITFLVINFKKNSTIKFNKWY